MKDLTAKKQPTEKELEYLADTLVGRQLVQLTDIEGLARTLGKGLGTVAQGHLEVGEAASWLTRTQRLINEASSALDEAARDVQILLGDPRLHPVHVQPLDARQIAAQRQQHEDAEGEQCLSLQMTGRCPNPGCKKANPGAKRDVVEFLKGLLDGGTVGMDLGE